MAGLTSKRCVPCEGGIPALGRDEARRLMAQLGEGWSMNEPATEIRRDFKFRNYYETMAFVNAVAYMAHQEDHHPDLEVGWGHCLVRYSTHAVKGLSENDFICAAKVDQIAAPPASADQACRI